MSRSRRHCEESGPSSHWEPPGYSGRSYYHDDHDRGHYAPPAEHVSRRSFNYWREESTPPTSYYARRPYGREGYDEQRHSDARPRQPSYPTRRRDSMHGRDRDDLGSRRDRHPSYRDSSSSHQRHPPYTPMPYIARPTFRARSPTEPVPHTLRRALAPLPPSPRKASPPPSRPSEVPKKPSAAYLALSQEPSRALEDPGRTRKLLVLDLNGTLLFRSPRSRTAPLGPGPHLRTVQPRPYMQSFREYLFCVHTKAWLDTMVWSSAQPHSVDDMVDKVFGPAKNELRAVWNRTSLGLSEEDYHRKAITTKDLAKPWEMLPSVLGPDVPKGEAVVPSQPPSQGVHSARTTLLLDDSPHKAALQPYNHVYIPEYDSARKDHDVHALRAWRAGKKAKRKHRAQAAASSPGGVAPEQAEEEPYDATLLAVVGILEAVKSQSNVAGWIRTGGLWTTRERGTDVTLRAGGEEGAVGNDASGDPTATSEQTATWCDDMSAVAYWVAQGRRAFAELGIEVVHGVTG